MSTDDLSRDVPFASASRWRWWVGTLGGAFLGAVLVLALFPKAMDPWAFQGVIEKQGLDFLFSARAVAFIGMAAEALLGFALLFGIRRRWVLWPSVALCAFFLFITGRHYYLHAHGLIDDTGSCGCFGDLITRTPAEAFWQDLFLLIPPLLFAFVGQPDPSQPQPWKRVAAVVGLALGTLIYASTVERPAALLRIDAKPSELCVGKGQARICLDAVIPELGDAGSDHLIVLVSLDDPALLDRLEVWGAHADAMGEPILWVVSPVGDQRLEAFQFQHQPLFQVLSAPKSLVDALSDALPAAFRVRDGRVTALWQDWPPTEALQADDPGDEGGGSDDDGSDPDDNAPEGNDAEDENRANGAVPRGKDAGAPKDGAQDDGAGDSGDEKRVK